MAVEGFAVSVLGQRSARRASVHLQDVLPNAKRKRAVRMAVGDCVGSVNPAKSAPSPVSVWEEHALQTALEKSAEKMGAVDLAAHAARDLSVMILRSASVHLSLSAVK